MLGLRLSPEIEARLAKLAKRTGRTKTFYAREAILRHLDELEDLYLAESRLEDLRNGRSEFDPAERPAPPPWRGGLSSSGLRRASSTSSVLNLLSVFFAFFATESPLSKIHVRSVRR